MGAGTSAGDAARSGRGTRQASEADGQAVTEPVAGAAAGATAGAGRESVVAVERTAGTEVTGAVAGTESTGRTAPSDPDTTDALGVTDTAGASDTTDALGVTDTAAASDTADAAEQRGRRFSLTKDTARPEGGGRAAPSDASAPVRQWPLLSVLGTTGLGLLIVGTHPFPEAFRVGTILIGIALIGGAVLRRVLPSVGMLAVRSRYTDMLTYGLLGLAIVLLSLMTQPKPWLEIPFLEDVVHSSVP
ncbi:DUF3017 domain-containing protein [Streptomyces sp. 35G-GA-8]|uniref:DUF3017 domain-containing protein n=1 Tax=Streptomyces sp. 35G-GA-8 TaxID=2939434 RepID=UPI00201E96B0|nr:DUF3017 domain-containing protein [Streptomyces sp. 35G-GA-8]MCL7376220.1 DUF3017 domain-containing protein [Streptomyces sp. 35G-GA-8]